MAEFARRLAAEALGTAFLLAAIVGSGLMAERLSEDAALVLLCNTLATAAMLFVIIAVFLPVSGAHFNPAVSFAAMLDGAMSVPAFAAYVPVQIAGAVAGVAMAHAMFGESVFVLGTNARNGSGQWLAEGVAAFGLVLTVLGTRGRSRETVGAAVALFIAAAYWFTSSTSFANPAVTLGRALTPSFSGIRPADTPMFIAAQMAGAAAGWAAARALLMKEHKRL